MILRKNHKTPYDRPASGWRAGWPRQVGIYDTQASWKANFKHQKSNYKQLQNSKYQSQKLCTSKIIKQCFCFVCYFEFDHSVLFGHWELQFGH
ncbi:MAG: hypothetical protein GY868_16255 [Deltaproteobacteria bacterium]|nr:hypothetical protein [Deltaproteobacteria bacterium]